MGVAVVGRGGLVNAVTGSEGLEVFWVGYESCSSVKNDGDVSPLKLSWEATSCNNHFCLKKGGAVGWIAFSVLRLTKLGYS